MDMISAVNHIDGRMHLDSADLRSCQILLVIDMMNVIVFYDRKYAAQMPDDPRLSAVMDVAPADNMRTDPLLRPAFPPGLANGVPLCLGTVLIVSGGPFVVVLRLQIFAKRDAAASGSGDGK